VDGACTSVVHREAETSTPRHFDIQPRSPVLLVVIKTRRLFPLLSSSNLIDQDSEIKFEKIRRIGPITYVYLHTQHSKRTTYRRLRLDFNLEQQINRSSIRLSISRNSTALQSILYHPSTSHPDTFTFKSTEYTDHNFTFPPRPDSVSHSISTPRTNL
jgi:hypothetical protein